MLVSVKAAALVCVSPSSCLSPLTSHPCYTCLPLSHSPATPRLLPVLSTLQLPPQQMQLYNQPVARTTEEAGVPGLFIIPDFISQQEEAALLSHIDQQPWQALSKRRVQHYGYCFEYTQRGVDLKQQVGSMPEWSRDVVQKVQVRNGAVVCRCCVCLMITAACWCVVDIARHYSSQQVSD